MSGSKTPKNFRNGDVIKVSRGITSDEREQVFVKFGDNYYNLSVGGQMKAYKYLPTGNRFLITNLAGTGDFFLLTEEQLAASLIETMTDGKLGKTEDSYRGGSDDRYPVDPITRLFRHVNSEEDSTE